jgi:hypothetical protein
MRSTESIMVLLGLLIIILAGFVPLFDSRDRPQMIRQECEMFYGQAGRAAVEHCMAERSGYEERVARQ